MLPGCGKDSAVLRESEICCSNMLHLVPTAKFHLDMELLFNPSYMYKCSWAFLPHSQPQAQPCKLFAVTNSSCFSPAKTCTSHSCNALRLLMEAGQQGRAPRAQARRQLIIQQLCHPLCRVPLREVNKQNGLVLQRTASNFSASLKSVTLLFEA